MLKVKHQISKKMFFDTLIVLLVAELTGAITCLIDGIITGRILGNDAMAAQGYSCTYFSIVSIVNGILMVGNQALCVGTISKGDKESTNKIMSITLIVGVVLTLLITNFIFFFAPVTAKMFGADSNNTVVFNNVTSYLKGVCLGAPFWCMFVAFTPIIQLDGGANRAKIAALALAITDVVLDVIFAKVLKMGMFGMGLATAMSHLAGFLVTFSHFISKKSTYKFTFKDLGFKYIIPIFKNGLPRAVSMLARTIGPILLNLIVLKISTDSTNALSALAVQRSITIVAASLGWSISGTALMLGTLFYNEKNLTEIKLLIKRSLLSIVILVGCLTIILVCIRPLIVRIYQKDWQTNSELYNLTLTALKYYLLSLPFVAFNVSFASYIQSVGKNVLANIINACTECVSLVVACYIISKTYEYPGFFYGFLIGELCLSLISIILIIINKVIHQHNPYSLYFLNQDFVNDQDKILSASLDSITDAEELSIEAMKLCEGTHLTPSQAYRLSLCVEEMATNVFIHGVTKDNKKHIIEMRIVISDNSALISLIDDCKKFDISKKLKTWELDQEHPEKNIGIRTIMAAAKTVTYANTMNFNNLQITI